MSSSTSRLQLTKLADGENFSNSVLNANWDKVDNGYGTLNSQIGSFSIRSITVPYTAAASTQYNTNLYTLINADLPSGYTCLGIVGNSTSSQYVYFIGCYYANSAYSFQVKNISTSSVTENAIIKYLCAKLS